MSSPAMADLLISHYLATRDKHLVTMETVGESTCLPFGRGCRRYEYLMWGGVVTCDEVRCSEVEYSVVRCVVPFLPLCFHCRYHDTVNEEERCTFNLFYVLTAVLSLPPSSSTPVF